MEPVVQLPMPIPANYNYDPRDNSAVNARAKREYDKAVEVWTQVVQKFAETHKLPDADKPT